MLSKSCDGCSQMQSCKIRYQRVQIGGFVYCEDGTKHLVDSASKTQKIRRLKQ